MQHTVEGVSYMNDHVFDCDFFRHLSHFARLFFTLYHFHFPTNVLDTTTAAVIAITTAGGTPKVNS